MLRAREVQDQDQAGDRLQACLDQAVDRQGGGLRPIPAATW